MPVGLVVGICSVIAFVTSCVSTYLTGMFMYNLSGDDQVLKGVFTILGVSLDIVKHILPVVVFYSFAKRSYSFGVMLCVFYVGLSAFSFISSVSAIEGRVEQSLQTQVQNTTVLAEIELLTEEKEGKIVLLTEQKSVNQVSAMKVTSKEISALNMEIRSLMNKTTPSEESIISSMRGVVIYMSSGLIELIGLVLMICVLKLDTRKIEKLLPLENAIKESLIRSSETDSNCKTADIKEAEIEVSVAPSTSVPSSNSVPSVSVAPSLRVEPTTGEATMKPEIVPSVQDKADLPVVASQNNDAEIVGRGVSDTQDALVETQCVSAQVTDLHGEAQCESQVVSKPEEVQPTTNIEMLRQSILTRVVEPKVRQIMTKHRVSREEIRECLNKMADAGELVRGKGNRFSLAS